MRSKAMGRKAIPLEKRRQPITISLPLDIITAFEATMKEGESRSAAIERIMRVAVEFRI